MRLKVALALVPLVLFTGCSRDIDSGSYHSAHVGEASETYEGTIISVRAVKVNEAERLQDNQTGGAVGALGGAALGSQIGGGKARLATGAGGAILGAVAGTLIQRQLGRQTGLEYVVKLTTGRLMTVVQGPKPHLQPGQRVFVQIGQAGRSRVIAF